MFANDKIIFSMKEKLRIGILLNDYSIPSWEYKILEDLSGSDFAEFISVIKSGSVKSDSE